MSWPALTRGVGMEGFGQTSFLCLTCRPLPKVVLIFCLHVFGCLVSHINPLHVVHPELLLTFFSQPRPLTLCGVLSTHAVFPQLQMFIFLFLLLSQCSLELKRRSHNTYAHTLPPSFTLLFCLPLTAMEYVQSTSPEESRQTSSTQIHQLLSRERKVYLETACLSTNPHILG